MAEVLVVGSGASAVHFALTALERGHAVTMVDVGYPRPEVPEGAATLEELKDRLDDPVAYFLGPNGEGVVYPGRSGSYYGHPPSKGYVFRGIEHAPFRASEMEPLFTYARGGFAEAWTAGCYAFSPDDFVGFPIGYSDLEAHYGTVAERIGVGGSDDDLRAFMPLDAPHLPPLPLDPHSERLLKRYRGARDSLHDRGFYLGRSRVATLSTPYKGRSKCTQLGRCLWGCPTGALYSPSHTLAVCLTHPRFRYLPGRFVTHFSYGAQGKVDSVHTIGTGGGTETHRAEVYVLAAGTLGSSRIVLESVARRTGDVPRLGGLMDNRQVHMPFLTPRQLGMVPAIASYQFHHLAFTLTRPNPAEHIHGQITTLRGASLHPIAAGIPVGLRHALRLFQALRSTLGIANVNLPDRRRTESLLSLDSTDRERPRLLVDYREAVDAEQRRRMAVRDVARALRRLGAWTIPGLTRVLPMGASVHYAGTLPMTTERSPFTVDPSCRSREFPNLLVVDGSVFPRLPAKNLTFTLMANATRVASTAV